MPAARAPRSTRRSRGCRSSRRSCASRSTSAPRTRRAWRRSRASSATDERALSPGPCARPAEASPRAGAGHRAGVRGGARRRRRADRRRARRAGQCARGGGRVGRDGDQRRRPRTLPRLRGGPRPRGSGADRRPGTPRRGPRALSGRAHRAPARGATARTAARTGGGTEPRRRRARRGRPPRRLRTEEAMRVIKGLVLLGLSFKVMVLGLWCWDSVAHAERQTKPTDAVAETALVPSDLLARTRGFHDLLDAVRQRGQELDEREQAVKARAAALAALEKTVTEEVTRLEGLLGAKAPAPTAAEAAAPVPARDGGLAVGVTKIYESMKA